MSAVPRPIRVVYLTVLLLALSGLACSGLNDVIGQRPARPTPTPPPFATATPGGRISVLLTTDQPAPPATSIGTPQGEIVAPAATATALYGTLQAATAAAAVTSAAPMFLPGQCPAPGGPPPPDKPTAFTQYPEAIVRYLSAGGPTTVLEAVLRSWGAVNEGAVVQSDTDLTGDALPEIVITLYDPAYFQPGRAAPGMLLVFGCAQQAYRLLFNTLYSPETAIPQLLRVGDMNGDVRGELVYAQQTCALGRCTQRAYILSWSATLGVFKPLNDVPIEATNGKVAIGDPDGDGILELLVTLNPPVDPLAGPPRRVTEVWDWDTLAYVKAVIWAAPPVYRIHALHDADELFSQQDWAGAIRAYDRVRDDPSLQGWPLPNEPILLRAYATLQKMLAQIGNNQRRNATNTLAQLVAENPAGSPGEGYALIGQAFMENYDRTRNRNRACTSARQTAATRPETLYTLNSYGPTNRAYALEDLCPFE